MQVITAPDTYQSDNHQNNRTIFLAGGITDCPNWQDEIVEIFQGVATHLSKDVSRLILFNPRQKDFPIHDPKAAESQIRWEYNHLRLANAISFWFPQETLCPIVLYELGAWSMARKLIYVGAHPAYARLQDIEIQTKLVRPDIEIRYSLYDLAKQVIADLRFE